MSGRFPTSRFWVALLVCVATIGVAVPAHADKDKSAKAAAVQAEARKLATKGDFKAAAAKFEQAFALDASKNSLFGWAQAERMAGNCRAAYFNYARVLRMTPTAKQVEVVQYGMRECEKKLDKKQIREIRARLDELDRQVKEREKQAALAQQRADLERKRKAEEEREKRKRAREKEIAELTKVEREEPASRLPAYILLAAGGAGLLAGGGALYLAHDYGGREAADYGEQLDFNDKAETWELVSTISLATGSGLAIAGAIYFLATGSDEPEATVTFLSGPGDLGFAIGGRF